MEKKTYPSELQERFIVRLPDGMRDRISEAAEQNGRSMNSEIVARLLKSFESEVASPAPSPIVDMIQNDAEGFQRVVTKALEDALKEALGKAGGAGALFDAVAAEAARRASGEDAKEKAEELARDQFLMKPRS